jgi:tetratricopeptide (TPR) repeat protein
MLAAIALMAMGMVTYRQVGYWKNSITLFSHTVKVTHDNALAYYNLGTAYGKSGRWQDAIDACEQAIRINPNYAEAYNNLGVVYEGLGRGTEAIDAYKQTIKIKPDFAEAYNNLGAVYDKLGRSAEAIDAYRQAIRFKPDFAITCYNLGIVCARLGRSAEAIEAFKQAIRVNPGFAEAYNSFAFFIATNPQIKNRDTNEAIRLARSACELADYKAPAFLDTLAVAQASAGKFSEAIDTANKALNLAEATNQPQIRDTIAYHLSFYKQGKPYIESVPQPLFDANKP